MSRQLVDRDVRRQERLAAIGELSAGLSHEFGNLLAILSAQFESLEKLTPDSFLKTHTSNVIRKQFARALTLSEAVKAFAAHRPLSARPCRVSPLVQEILELFADQLQEHRVHVVVAWADNDWVAIDDALLQHVLLNLLANAIEAVRNVPEPLISFQVQRKVDDVLVRVGNNGPIILPGFRKVLFRPFQTTKTGARRGTGLGLSFSRTLVKHHRGTLTLENRPGTVFRIRLPAASSPEGECPA